MTTPLLRVRDLRVGFDIPVPGAMPWTPPRRLHAVGGLDLDLMPGETLGIVGESGSGKSTVAGVITGLIGSGQGTTVTGSIRVSVDGREIEAIGARGADEALLRRGVAMVFQDPAASLDPRMTVAASIGEPLRTHRLARRGGEIRDRAEKLLSDVSLDASFLDRYPHEVSGGQRQRVCIARALASEPEILILDESTASLDVSVQAGVLDLLAGLQREKGLT